jgi:hypothetical protein
MIYLAEFYFPGDATALAELARRARAAAPAAAAAAPAAAAAGVPAAGPAAADTEAAGFVLAILVPADETCFVLYSASDADAVRSAGQRAGITFERVGAARFVGWPA